MLKWFRGFECSDGDAAREKVEEDNKSFNFFPWSISMRPLLHTMWTIESLLSIENHVKCGEGNNACILLPLGVL
jgi:hypothetical protein